jgi:nicotinamide N-methyltransferase
VATDYADASLMENISFNASANGATLHAVGHTWGKAVDDLLSAGTGGRYDVVILSDLMFNHSQHDALIATLDKTLKLGPGQPSMPEEERGTTSTTPDLPAHVAQNPLPPTPCALVFLTHHRPRLADEDMAFFPRLAKHGWGYERVTHEYTGPMFENDPGDERVRGTVHGFRCWRL